MWLEYKAFLLKSNLPFGHGFEQAALTGKAVGIEKVRLDGYAIKDNRYIRITLQ